MSVLSAEPAAAWNARALAGGARRWFLIRGLGIQPSEFVKLGAVAAIAYVLRSRTVRGRPSRQIMFSMAVAAVPFLLVIAQPDLATSIVFPSLALGMVWWAGVSPVTLYCLAAPVVSMACSFSTLSWGVFLDWGPIVMGFIGFWLLGNAYLALGLFVSSISENQVVSAIVTFGCLLIFWMLDWVAGVTDGAWSHFFAALSPIDHYREFTMGVLDLSNVAYFCFFHLYFLFLALRAVETRHWKG